MTLILTDHLALTKLSEIQRSLGPLDIEGLSALATGKSSAMYPNEPLPVVDAPEVQGGEDPTLDEWRKSLDASHHKLKDNLSSAPADYCSIIIRGHEDKVKSAAWPPLILIRSI